MVAHDATIGPHALYSNSLVCSRSIADFEIIEQVGEGHLSAVLHCMDIGSGIHVAVKSYHKDRMNIISSRQVPAHYTADLCVLLLQAVLLPKPGALHHQFLPGCLLFVY